MYVDSVRQFPFYFIFCHSGDNKKSYPCSLLNGFAVCVYFWLTLDIQTFMEKLSKFAASRTGSVMFLHCSGKIPLADTSFSYCLFITPLIILLSFFNIFMFFTTFVWQTPLLVIAYLSLH